MFKLLFLLIMTATLHINASTITGGLAKGDGLNGYYNSTTSLTSSKVDSSINFNPWSPQNDLPESIYKICDNDCKWGGMYYINIVWRGYIELPTAEEYEIKIAANNRMLAFYDINQNIPNLNSTSEIPYPYNAWSNSYIGYAGWHNECELSINNSYTCVNNSDPNSLIFKISQNNSPIINSNNSKFYPISIAFKSTAPNPLTILSWRKAGTSDAFTPIPQKYLYSEIPIFIHGLVQRFYNQNGLFNSDGTPDRAYKRNQNSIWPIAEPYLRESLDKTIQHDGFGKFFLENNKETHETGFSAVWTGYIYLPEAKKYNMQIQTYTSDNRVEVDILDLANPANSLYVKRQEGVLNSTIPIDFTSSGGYYPIRVKLTYYDGSYGGVGDASKPSIQLEWKNGTLAFQTIPTENLVAYLPTSVGKESYCAKHNLPNGFHIINPLNNKEKQFEVFCQYKRDFIVLPNSNPYNNFTFDITTMCDPSVNSGSCNGKIDYYDSFHNTRKHFHVIEINANTMEVIPGKMDFPEVIPQLDTYGNLISSFAVMPGKFSNINLIGTPFGIDYDSLEVTGLSGGKGYLKRGSFDRAVKIDNSKKRWVDSSGKIQEESNIVSQINASIATIKTMKLKLASNYKYEVDSSGKEILERSCKDLANKNGSAKETKGLRWIARNWSTREMSAQNLRVDYINMRPIVAYCAPYLQAGTTNTYNVWTTLLVFDGKPTKTSSDLIGKKDTCSRFGMYPFISNNEQNFELAREYLNDIKPEWVNYIKSIGEKITNTVKKGDSYYLSSENNSLIWPYGTFGIYFPHDGNKNIENKDQTWGNSAVSKPGWMSGSPMHNIANITENYEVFTDGAYKYYENMIFSTTSGSLAKDNYTYNDTMGAKGWKSVMADYNLKPEDAQYKTNDWFVSRAGSSRNTNHGSNYPEPNGNYKAGCWLNFLYDSKGRVRHLDDYNCNYVYYDYMCMAADNYSPVTQDEQRVTGKFDAVDAGSNFTTKKVITTKIVNKPFELDLYVTKSNIDDTLQTSTTDISAGIFIVDENGIEIKYLGEFASKTGKQKINPVAIDRAIKAAEVKFKYCTKSDLEMDLTRKWTECWNEGVGGVKINADIGDSTNSSDKFAIRPDRFNIPPIEESLKAGVESKIRFEALNYNNNTPTLNFSNDYAISSEYNKKDTDNCKATTNGFIPLSTSYILENLDKGYYKFKDGISVQPLQYNDVGTIKIILEEISGSEFAIVDKEDTPDEDRFIEPADTQVTFIPHHFTITNKISSQDKQTPTDKSSHDFVYYNNATPNTNNMSAQIYYTITAMNGLESPSETLNYDPYCVKTETKSALVFDEIKDITNLTEARYFIKPTDKELEKEDYNESVNQKIKKLPFSEIDDILVDFEKGKASKAIYLNFDRNISEPTEPTKVTFKNVKLGDSDELDLRGATSTSLTFLYGRVYSPDIRTKEKIYDSYINFEFYCKNGDDSVCNDFKSTNNPNKDDNWYINVKNTKDDPINPIVYDAQRSLLIPEEINNGIKLLKITPNTIPSIINIDISKPEYLMHNRYNVNNFRYTVEFLSPDGNVWGGTGGVNEKGDKTENIGANVNHGNSATRPNNRVRF